MAYNVKQHRSAIRRHRTELPKSTASSGSMEKLVATRRKMRRLQSALRRLEQLSTSMETHYQNMLRELGQWIIKIAQLLQAPDIMQSLKFPEIPSHVGTWFVQTCSVAEWSVVQLKTVIESEPSHATVDKSSTCAMTYTVVEKEAPLISKEAVKSNAEKNSPREPPTKNGKTVRKTSLSTSPILATVKETSKPKDSTTNKLMSKMDVNGNAPLEEKKSLDDIEKEMPTNDGEGKSSDISNATYTIVKDEVKPNSIKGETCPVSSDDLSLSGGSLGSVFSPLETSDCANVLASTYSNDARLWSREEYWKQHKLAEEKLIAILDGLRQKILDDSQNQENI